MKYLQRSFSVGGPLKISQEEWDAIFRDKPLKFGTRFECRCS
jgi:hypothetical protein